MSWLSKTHTARYLKFKKEKKKLTKFTVSIKNKRTPCDKQAEQPLVYYLISPFVKFWTGNLNRWIIQTMTN